MNDESSAADAGRTRIVIAGAAGRMGHMLIRCAHARRSIELVGAVECAGHDDLGRDAGDVAGIGTLGIAVTDDLAAVLERADVLVDFTLHTAAPGNVKVARSLRRAAVFGATGLTRDETDALMQAGMDIPIVWAPNMSLGMNFLFATVRRAAAVLGEDYRVKIDETHHVHKKDAPSGTALRLGEHVAEARGWNFDACMTHEEDGSREPGEKEVLIQSHREGEIVGIHGVSFSSAGETLELKHTAHSREAFAVGAMTAAAWVVRQRPRLYDMQDVLNLR